MQQLDNGLYDPDELFLKATFDFAKRHLSVMAKSSKKGRFYLIYSDLAQILELQAPNRIEELCKEHNMIVAGVKSAPFMGTEKQVRDSTSLHDPLFSYKAKAQVKVYEIHRA